jgi:hypothetical protein
MWFQIKTSWSLRREVLKCNQLIKEHDHGQTQEPENRPLSVARALDAIGERWSLLIVRDAFDGMRRFGEFRKAWAWRRTSWPTACTPWWKGIFTAARFGRHGLPEYVLTAGGWTCSRRRGFAPMERGAAVRARRSPFTLLQRAGLPVRKLEVLAEDGRILQAGDTVVHKVAPQ